MKINESQLRNIITKSIRETLNEVSVQTLDNAERKSGGWNAYMDLYKKAGYNSSVHKAIDTIEDELYYYAYQTNSGQAKKLLSCIDPLRDFFNRKGKQAGNFNNAMANERDSAEKELEAKSMEMFSKGSNELSDEEYESVLSNCSPRTQEYFETL